MIIFYKKDTGEIVGTIEGRIHDETHLKMHIGNEDEVYKLVIQWVPTTYYDESGNEVDKDSQNAFTSDFEPDHPQKDLIMLIETNSSEVYNYRIEKGKLVKK